MYAGIQNTFSLLISVSPSAFLREEAIGELFAATHVLSSVPPVGDFDKDPVSQLILYQLYRHVIILLVE